MYIYIMFLFIILNYKVNKYKYYILSKYKELMNKMKKIIIIVIIVTKIVAVIIQNIKQNYATILK